MVQIAINLPNRVVVAIQNDDNESMDDRTKGICVDAVVRAVKLRQNESEDESMSWLEEMGRDAEDNPPNKKRARNGPISPPFRYIDPPHVHLPLRSPHTPAPARHADHDHLTRNNDPSMQIFVKTLSGESVTLEVRPSTKIWELAEKFNHKIGAPRDMVQKFIYVGKTLEYHRELRWVSNHCRTKRE
jgi:hypothetical protein